MNYWLRLHPSNQLLGPVSARQVLAGLKLQEYSPLARISPATDAAAELPADNAVWITLGDPATFELLKRQADIERRGADAMEPLDAEHEESLNLQDRERRPSANRSRFLPTHFGGNLPILSWQNVLRHYRWMGLATVLLRLLAILLAMGIAISVIVLMMAVSNSSSNLFTLGALMFAQTLIGSVTCLALAEFIELVVRTSSDIAYLAEQQGRPVDPPQP